MSLMKIGVSMFALVLIGGAALAEGEQQGGPDRMAHWQGASPEQMAMWHRDMCTDRYAMEAGRLAYLEAKLAISGSQRPLFDRWRDVVLSSAKGRETACQSHAAAADHHPNALEIEAKAETMLADRLESLKVQRPVLESLYQSLSPDQKATFDEAAMRRAHELMEHGHMGHDGDDHAMH